ncbi:MAG: hypothetical protein FJ318_06120 [SAR202 cluster bacterium]|nr:hypothetical protein [SAR202 cluster bacterium]
MSKIPQDGERGPMASSMAVERSIEIRLVGHAYHVRRMERSRGGPGQWDASSRVHVRMSMRAVEADLAWVRPEDTPEPPDNDERRRADG